MKKISCGLIIHNGIELLTVHPTFRERWDIPKGEMDIGEEPEKTVIREVKEETNLDIDDDKIRLLGKFKYLPGKDLILFEYRTNDLPNISKMSCSSTYEWKGREVQEIDKYQYYSFEGIENWVWPKLGEIIKKLKLNN